MFSWGYGGGFLRGAGALGHGDIKSLSSPAVIEFFEKNVFNEIFILEYSY